MKSINGSLKPNSCVGMTGITTSRPYGKRDGSPLKDHTEKLMEEVRNMPKFRTGKMK